MCECQGNPLTRVTLALGLPYLLVNRALVQYHSKATDTVCSIKLKREEFLYIRTIFNFQAEFVLIYMLLFLPNFSLGVLNPHVLVCGFLLFVLMVGNFNFVSGSLWLVTVGSGICFPKTFTGGMQLPLSVMRCIL